MPARIDILREMLKKEPKEAFLNYAMALEYEKLGEIIEAISILERLIENHPDYLGAYYKLGRLFEESGKGAKAKNIYLKGLDIARSQDNTKTLSELNEAILCLEEE